MNVYFYMKSSYINAVSSFYKIQINRSTWYLWESQIHWKPYL